MWRNPGIVPLLHTPGIVVKKLQGGADLMTPGLANGPPFPAKAKKGAVVAVASLDNPSVPVCVGQCIIDISELGDVQGSRGHAVQTLHWAGDEIWAYSTSGKAGVDPPDHIEEWLPAGVDGEELAGQTASMGLEDEEEGGVALGGAAPSAASDAQGHVDVPEDGPEPNEAETVQMTTKGMFSHPSRRRAHSH